MTTKLTTRPATKADASEIALLVNIATHGGMVGGWARDASAKGTYDPVEVGRLHATMAESGGEIAGMLLGYREPDKAEPMPADTGPFFVPLFELEAAAAGTWFVNMLGVHISWRSKGVGSMLLEIAEIKARETMAHGLGLIVEDVNEGARQLYERRGFGVRTSRPMMNFQGGPAGGDWLLMVKD